MSLLPYLYQPGSVAESVQIQGQVNMGPQLGMVCSSTQDRDSLVSLYGEDSAPTTAEEQEAMNGVLREVPPANRLEQAAVREIRDLRRRVAEYEALEAK